MKEKKIKNITENWSIWGCRGYCGQFLHHSNNWEIERAELIYISFRKKMRALESEDAVFDKCLSIQENRSHISYIALSFETNKNNLKSVPKVFLSQKSMEIHRKAMSLKLFSISHKVDPFSHKCRYWEIPSLAQPLAPGDQRCKMDIQKINSQNQIYSNLNLGEYTIKYFVCSNKRKCDGRTNTLSS